MRGTFAGYVRGSRLGRCAVVVASLSIVGAGVAGLPGDPATLGSTVALASYMSSSPASSVMGVYTGPVNVSAAQAVNTASGGQVRYAMDFLDGSSWASISDPNWFASQWAGSGFKMIWGVPILPNSGGSLAQGASGAYNTYFVTLAQRLVADGQGSSIIRLGWEFNGGWFPWAANGQAAAFVQYWKNIVTSMRSVAGQQFQFEWNPTRGDLGVGNLANYYPGDAYVDIIGLDVYDTQWPSMPGNATEWNTILTEPYGLNWLTSFAASHGKPVSLPEWGLWNDGSAQGSGDNATFVNEMMQWISTNNVVNAIFWDYGTSSSSSVPQSYQAFISDLQAGEGGASTSVTTGSSAGGGTPPSTTEAPPSTTAAPPTTLSSPTTVDPAADPSPTAAAPTTVSPPTTLSSPTTVDPGGDPSTTADPSTPSSSPTSPSVPPAPASAPGAAAGTSSTRPVEHYTVASASGGLWSFTAGAGTRVERSAIPRVVGVAGAGAPGAAWLVNAAGRVQPIGGAVDYGSARRLDPGVSVVAIAATPDHRGYWLLTDRGQVIRFGDARFEGSNLHTGGGGPFVAIAAAPTGEGYWLVTRGGRVFNHGTARFAGSAWRRHIAGSFVALQASPGGAGYWLVAANGRVIAFGDATRFVSSGRRLLSGSVSGMASTPDLRGFWLVTRSGVVRGFGDAHDLGQPAGRFARFVGIG